MHGQKLEDCVQVRKRRRRHHNSVLVQCRRVVHRERRLEPTGLRQKYVVRSKKANLSNKRTFQYPAYVSTTHPHEYVCGLGPRVGVSLYLSLPGPQTRASV